MCSRFRTSTLCKTDPFLFDKSTVFLFPVRPLLLPLYPSPVLCVLEESVLDLEIGLRHPSVPSVTS